MSNDVTCKTTRVCNIRLNIFEGWVRTLKDVRHFSDLRKILLPFGALEAQGYKFSGIDGVLKVTKDSMTVLKAKCTVNLYNMIGSVMNDDDSVTTEKENTTRLWHMRLGHMSE